jgi:hypothetical protein
VFHSLCKGGLTFGIDMAEGKPWRKTTVGWMVRYYWKFARMNARSSYMAIFLLGYNRQSIAIIQYSNHHAR